MYKFDKCQSSPDCFLRILVNSLLEWPKFVTAIPAVKSIYFLFLKSHTREPLAFFTTKLAGA